MSKYFQIRAYLTYWLNSVSEHSLHSPFFFDFYTRVVQSVPSNFEGIESLRAKLLANERTITVNDLGAGSVSLKGDQRKVSDIARTSLSTSKYSSLYRRVVEYYQARNVIELGTSLGINTLYLAAPEVEVTTFEGAPAIADIARTTFEFAGASRIHIKEGDIDRLLPDHLQRSGKVDLAFLDANHRYEATMVYAGWFFQKIHDQSILILDDIHHSEGMERAWNELRKHSLVYGSADLFRCGFLFFNPSLNKQHVVLQF